jgi:hypothetical protein
VWDILSDFKRFDGECPDASWGRTVANDSTPNYLYLHSKRENRLFGFLVEEFFVTALPPKGV